MFLTLLYTNLCLSQETLSIVELMPNDTPPNEVATPTVVVDIFGNTDWKYPKNYFDPPKAVVKPKELVSKEKDIINYPKYRPFEKGSNTQHSIYASGAFFGSLQGFDLGYSYSSNYISHCIEYKSYQSAIYQVAVITNVVMTNYKFEYHAFPMWYSNNKSFKTFDAGLSASAGQFQSTNSAGVILGTSAFIGFGGFLKYPISEHIKVKVNVEFNEPLASDVSIGSAGSVGLSFDF